MCLNSRVWLPADRFGQGSGPVFSPLSLINHLSPQSLRVFVCLVVTWFWFAFVNTHQHRLSLYLTVLPHRFNLYLNRQIFTALPSSCIKCLSLFTLTCFELH